MNKRHLRFGIGSAAALALLAGTAAAQQAQTPGYDRQMGEQVGMEYRDTGEWREADFVRELSDSVVILKSENEDYEATVHILHGEVSAKLDGEELPSEQVQTRGEKIRLLDDEGETVAEFTLPDLQTIREAQLRQRQQFQPGLEDHQPDMQERHLGIQEQWDEEWHDDWRHQEDWRFQDRQRFEDQRFRDHERVDDRRWRDDQRFRDQERHIGDMRQDFRDEFRAERMPGRPIERQLGIMTSRATERDLRMTDHRQGLVIEDVQPGSPLDNFGIRSGDVIVSVDGRPATRNHLERTIMRMDERDTLRLTLVRDGAERTFNVRGTEIVETQRLETRRIDRFDRDGRVLGAPDPTFRQPPVIGVQMREARRTELRRTPAGDRYDSGIEITRVQRGSPADRAGLRSRDIIVEIDGTTNVTPDDLRQELGRTRPGDTLELTVIRGGRERDIDLRVQDRVFGIPEERFRDDYRSDDRRVEPSRQERLFRLPGQVPPGPDRGIYRPSYDEPRLDDRDFDRWEDRWDTWERQDRPVQRDTWDRNGW